MKLLIVDDELSILTLLKAALGPKIGNTCDTASSAHEALELVRDAEEPYDCFLLDIQMPGMDGVELCKRLRGDSAYWDVPIIMLTAMSQMSYVDAAFRAGATDYVTKPFDFNDLRSRLAAVENPDDGDAPRVAKVTVSSEPFTSSRSASASDTSFRDEVQIDFSGIDRVIGGRQMFNYLRQTALSGNEETTGFAVSMIDGSAVLAPMSTSGYIAFLSKMAWALSEATKDTGALITYRGRGTFVCVENEHRTSKLDILEFQVQNSLQSAVGQELDPQIIVGHRVRKELKSPADAEDFLFQAEVSRDQSLQAHQEFGAGGTMGRGEGGFLRSLLRFGPKPAAGRY